MPIKLMIYKMRQLMASISVGVFNMIKFILVNKKDRLSHLCNFIILGITSTFSQTGTMEDLQSRMNRKTAPLAPV